MRARVAIFTTFFAVLAVPFLLSKRADRALPGALPLVILSPHNGAIQHEFERAFRIWYRAEHGRDVDIDWRNVGGTSEIMRFIDSEFVALGVATNSGIGVDLIFGGGSYDHTKQARKQHTVPCGLRERHPEWLTPAIIPRSASGEAYYDADDRWYGCCLSTFGICYNTDVLETRRIPVMPRTWLDLAHPAFFGQIALADPSKSGSITKAFEMLIQQQMTEEIRVRGKDPAQATRDDLAAGWRRAMGVIRQIAANARYFTDSASKVPLDVAHGNAAAGMCIDFYGRFQSEAIRRNEGSDRMHYCTPIAGSSVSADPISLLRGAPHRELAQQFIDFVLSVDGQKLWNYRTGTPGGPVTYALRRLPIRRDMYAPAHREFMADPTVDPYTDAARFMYRSAWTGRLFGLTRLLIRVMCMDTHEELARSWAAIQRAGGLAECPEAARVFLKLPPEAEYVMALDSTAGRIRDKLDETRLVREWIVFFRARYREAEKAALAGAETVDEQVPSGEGSKRVPPAGLEGTARSCMGTMKMGNRLTMSATRTEYEGKLFPSSTAIVAVIVHRRGRERGHQVSRRHGCLPAPSGHCPGAGRNTL